MKSLLQTRNVGDVDAQINARRLETHFLHMVQLFFGAGLCEKAERQLVEQKRCVEPLRW